MHHNRGLLDWRIIEEDLTDKKYDMNLIGHLRIRLYIDLNMHRFNDKLD